MLGLGQNLIRSFLTPKVKRKKLQYTTLMETTQKKKHIISMLLSSAHQCSIAAKGLGSFLWKNILRIWIGYDLLWLGFMNKYVVQRFAHFVYNQNVNNFEHVDCSVRIFNRDEYDKIYEAVSQDHDPGRKIGKRFKLFKISGKVDRALVEQSLYAFFRENIHLIEYFHNLDFLGVIKWFEKKQTEQIALKKKYDRNCPY